jgi:hypothetical protein
MHLSFSDSTTIFTRDVSALKATHRFLSLSDFNFSRLLYSTSDQSILVRRIASCLAQMKKKLVDLCSETQISLVKSTTSHFSYFCTVHLIVDETSTHRDLTHKQSSPTSPPFIELKVNRRGAPTTYEVQPRAQPIVSS